MYQNAANQSFKYMRKILFFVATLLSVSLYAEVFSLDSLLQRADEQSVQIRVSRSAVEAADESVKQARNQAMPNLQIEASVGYLGNGQLWDRDFTNYTRVENPHFTNNFAFRAQQVIYSGGALTAAYKLAQVGREMATLTMEQNRQEVRFVITGHYLDLCRLNNQLAVLQDNIALTDTLIDNVRTRVQAGTALATDLTRYELQLANLQLQLERTSNSRDVLSYQLATMLHTDSPIEVQPMAATESLLPSHSDWQTMAANSLSLQQAEAQVRVQQQQVHLNRAAMLPKIAIVAEDHLDGPITIEVPVLDKNFNYWFMGVGVQYDLSSIYKGRRAVRQSRLQLRQAQEQQALAAEQVEQAVQAAYSEWLTAVAEVQTQEKAVQLARENHAVMRYRYANGLCLLTDMLDADNAKLTAELGLVNAQINVQYSQSKLHYLTSTL